MITNKLLKISLVMLSLVFIFFKIFKLELYADSLAFALLVMFSVLYLRQTKALKKRNLFFLLFLICFALSQLLNFISHFLFIENGNVDYLYYVSNVIFMIAYIFLILRCVITMSFLKIIKKFAVTIIILLLLSIFCVTLITETAENQLSASQYMIEFLYNVVVMGLLSVSLINYMDKSDNKSMLFFMGCMFVFFSEMLQLAYYYIDELVYLAASYSVFLVLAFVFFYLQSKIKYVKQPNLSFVDSNY